MLIGENLHIISAKTKEAIAKRDSDFVLKNVKKQVENGVKTIDLNIGPAKAEIQGAMEWLIKLIQANFDVNFSLDTTNIEEIKTGFSLLKKPCKGFLNSTSADFEKLDATTDIVANYNANLIALTMNKDGIPKTADERMELAFNIIETANSKNIDNSKIYVDPLILPINVAQEQALVALEAIRMLKESFDPSVKTIVGLSNISNGSPRELRALINRVFLVLALGCGLDCAIIDAFDKETIRVYNNIKSQKSENTADELFLNLFNTMQNFGDLDDVQYDKNDIKQYSIYRCAQILLNKEIYSHSFI